MSTNNLSTTAEREEAKRVHNEAIEELNQKKKPYKEQLDKLKDENMDKIQAKDQLYSKWRSKKSSKTKRIVWGIIIAIIGVIIYAVTQNTLVAGAVITLGVLLLIIGIIMSGTIKKCAEEYEQACDALREYDDNASKLNEKIIEFDNKIADHKNEIDRINLKEKYAKVDKWIESISKGYVGMYVTGEVKYAGGHAEPTAKKYSQTTGQFSGVVGEIYINDMVYGSVQHNYDRDFDIFPVDEQGTQKLECVVYYQIGSYDFNYQTQAVPVRFDKSSKFCWFHVQTCMGGSDHGTRVYGYSFDDFESFLEATGIPKHEVMNKYIEN